MSNLFWKKKRLSSGKIPPSPCRHARHRRLVFLIFAFILIAMIKTTLTTLFCLISLALVSAVRAETPLEISMKHIAKAYHQLVADLKQPVDASKPDYLALAATMKTETEKARGFVPKKAAELPADQQAAMVTAFQKSIDDLSASIDVLSQDLQAGQWDAANKQLATLKMQEDDGHKAFRKNDKDEAGQKPPAAAAPEQAAPAPLTPSQVTPPAATPAPDAPTPAAPMQ